MGFEAFISSYIIFLQALIVSTTSQRQMFAYSIRHTEPPDTAAGSWKPALDAPFWSGP
jgi:hypothetical protein